MADVTLAVAAVQNTPLDYAVPGAAELLVKMLSASYNGAGAAGSFVPAVQVIIGGTLVAGTFPLGTTLAAGASADVSWFPRSGGVASSGGPTAGTLFLTAAGIWPAVTSGANYPTLVETATNHVDVYLVDFVNGSQTFAQATLAMPTDWNAGTVTATFYWLVNGATTGNAVWTLQGRAYGSGAALDQAFGAAVSVTSAAVGVANELVISSASAAMTFAGAPAAGQLAQFRISRNGSSGSDTLAATARLLGVQVSYGITD